MPDQLGNKQNTFTPLLEMFKGNADLKAKFIGQPWKWRRDWSQGFSEINEYKQNLFVWLIQQIENRKQKSVA